jgi:hypothetical protein
MSSQSEMMPLHNAPARAGRWAGRLVRLAYLSAIAVAMTGWLIALAWGSFSLLSLLL